MRIQDEILSSVVFIGYPKSQDYTDDTPNDQLTAMTHWCGTGFVVVVPTPCGRFNVGYLITAKHVAFHLEGRQVFIRTNHVGGGVAFFKLPKDVTWFRHPADPNGVDIAVAHWSPTAGVADVSPIGIGEWFLTEEILEKRQIGPGDNVFAVGLFSLVIGQQRNWPIGTGNIAMMPDERIPRVNTGGWSGSVEGYLIESRSFGGLSGSPVFVRPTFNFSFVAEDGEATVGYAAGQPYLLGLVQGHWAIRDESINDSFIRPEADREKLNLGFAIVVPAKKILEVLNQPALIKIREEFAASGGVNPSA